VALALAIAACAPCRHVRTCVRVTSQGHPWAIYDRAIKAGSLAGAVAAAHNLNQPIVPDQALRLLLLYLRHDPGRYPRAAARWAASAATRQALDLRGLALPLEPNAHVAPGPKSANIAQSLDGGSAIWKSPRGRGDVRRFIAVSGRAIWW
jgi:hypothetical protein